MELLVQAPAERLVHQPLQPKSQTLRSGFAVVAPARIAAQPRHQAIGLRQGQVSRRALAFFLKAFPSTASSSSV